MSKNTIFNEVKELLDARDVVSDILGEPAKTSGDNWYWHSPFKEDDNDPSFCANSKFISDFCDGSTFDDDPDKCTGNDVFNFIVKYNNATHKISDTDMNNYDALKYLVEKYELDIEVNTFETEPFSTKSKKKKTKTVYSLKLPDYISETTDISTYQVYAYFDDEQFDNKPTAKVGIIKDRIDTEKAEIYMLRNIKENILNGQTCIPSGVKSKKDWIDDKSSYQIFMVDFDNATTINKKKVKFTVDDERHITVEKILEYCKEKQLIPTFIYYTFSHSENQHKFRLVYILDKPTKKLTEIEGIYKTLKEIFKDYYMDNSATDVARLFFGGKELAFESNNIYKIATEDVEIEEDEDDNVEEVKYTDIEKQCNQYLQYSLYEARNEHLGYITKNDSFVPISNFIPYCTEKINYINGNDKITKYKMNCVLIDTPHINLQPLIVDANAYARCDFVLGSSWDKHCIISAGNGNTGRLREVMQIVSRQEMKEKTVYTHTGFRRIRDKLCYLYHNGIIGDIQDVETDLSTDKLQQYCFTNKTFDIKDSTKRSLSFLDTADYSITMPILATIYLAPLKSLLDESNILSDYILFIKGQSGTRKSSLTAVALSHFGKFNRDKFPCSFRDTLNSIEKKSFILKDTVNLVDDFNPENVGSKKLDIMEKLFGMYGDRSGRTRMAQDGQTLREPYTARGLCIVTGEMAPEVAQSRIARCMFVNIEPKSINLQKLSELQDNTEELSYCMMNFILWIIHNEDKVINYAIDTFKKNQGTINSDSKIHGRTSEIANILPIGFTLFTHFAHMNGVINDFEKSELDRKFSEVINKLVDEQSNEVQELKPVEMFYTALEELLTTKKIYVTNVSTRNTIGNLTDIGFYDPSRNKLCLYPNSVYNEVTKFYGGKFPVPAKTLWRYMAEEGCLYQNDKSRFKVSRTIFGKQISVIEIDAKNMEILQGGHFVRPVSPNF